MPARPSSLRQSPSAEPLGSFQFLAIINITAMNISVQITFLVFDWETFPKWNYEVIGHEQFCSSCHVPGEFFRSTEPVYHDTNYGWLSLQPSSMKVHCFSLCGAVLLALGFPHCCIRQEGCCQVVFSVYYCNDW